MKTKSVEHVKKLMLKTQQKLIAHCCSLCGYPCGYLYISNHLYYDSGCDCTDEKIMETRDEKELEDWIIKNL